jgi:shikimate kinase
VRVSGAAKDEARPPLRGAAGLETLVRLALRRRPLGPGRAFLALLAPGGADLLSLYTECGLSAVLLPPSLAAELAPLLDGAALPAAPVFRLERGEGGGPRLFPLDLTEDELAASERVLGAEAGGPPTILALVGPMASGKTTVGALLAPALGLPFRDLDAEIAARAGLAIPDIFQKEGEAGFRQREIAQLGEVLAGPPCVLATGGGAVLSPAGRALLAARSLAFWLHAEPRILAARSGSSGRPLLAGREPEPALREIYARRLPLYAEVARCLVATEGRSPFDLARDIAGFSLLAGGKRR